MEGTVNENYTRVCPRDLFNEAVLLKCLGKLVLRIHEVRVGGLQFHDAGNPFVIGLHSAGYLTVTRGLVVAKNAEMLWFGTPYNSRKPWPLEWSYMGEEFSVFTDDGEFDPEFLAALNDFFS